MHRLAGLVVIVVTGCYRPTEVLCDGARCAPDGPADPTDTATGEVCVGVAAHPAGQRCFVPDGPLALGGSLDVDGDPRCSPAHLDACVVVATDLQIEGHLDVIGGRPLILWASHDIAVAAGAILDAASHSDTAKRGPGSNPAVCPDGLDGVTLPNPFPAVAGGGSGGGFGTAGGTGGPGRNTNNLPTGSSPSSSTGTLALRGGCDGGRGGFQPNEAALGRGGGAIYLMAGATISIEGVIDASGSGGAGGIANTNQVPAGNGGGSGGLIGLEATTIALSQARLVALGGAGGAGATTTVSGDAGPDPAPNPPSTALGPNETTSANRGGDGCATDGTTAGDGGLVVSSIGSGGGGGGGCGRIVIFGGLSSTGSRIAPPPQ